MPVITNDTFKTAVTENLKEVPPKYKNSVTEHNQEDLIKMVETEINQVESSLKSLRSDDRFEIGGGGKATFQKLKDQGKKVGYCVVKEAFNDTNRKKLLGFFASTLLQCLGLYSHLWTMKEYYERLAAYNIKSEPKGPKPSYPDGKCMVTTKMKSDFVSLSNDSMLKQIISKRTKFFKDNIEKMCKRLCDDWDDINTLFFRGRVLKKLVKISTTGSDFHKKGKQVLILTFKIQKQRQKINHYFCGCGPKLWTTYTKPKSQLAKLVYKPSDVELDCRVTGRIGALKTRLKGVYDQLGDQSLFTKINREMRKNPIGDEKPPFQLPVYKILPRNFGSSLNYNGDTLPIENSYGYIEFLTHDPEYKSEAQLKIDLPPDRAKWDYVTQDPGTIQGDFDLKNYYRVFGWYIVFSMLLSFGDQHQENIIVHDRKPYLIDLEIIFKGRAKKITNTGMHEIIRDQNPEKFKNTLLCRKNNADIVKTMGQEAEPHIKNGFNEAISWFKGEANKELFSKWLKKEEMKKVVCRHTPRATADYSSEMLAVIGEYPEESIPTDGDDDSWKRKPYIKYPSQDVMKWHEQNGSGFHGAPLFALSTKEHDWACYNNGDVPVYYRRLGELELLNARGKKVVVNNPGGPEGFKLSLEKSIQVVDKKATLDLPEGDKSQKIRISAKESGDIGLDIRVKLQDNPGGDGDEPLKIETTERDKGNANEGKLNIITVTFGRVGGAKTPPKLSALKDALNSHANSRELVQCELLPTDADGNLDAEACDEKPLWAPNPGLTLKGNKFFDMDANGIYAALDPIKIALSRYEGVVGNLGNQVESKVEGANKDQDLKLSAVIDDFKNFPATLLTEPKGLNF
ncbi:MAG: DUF4135 domain-containing protein [Desulfobacterales bacterium]